MQTGKDQFLISNGIFPPLSDRLEERVALLRKTGRLTPIFEAEACEIRACRRTLGDRVRQAR